MHPSSPPSNQQSKDSIDYATTERDDHDIEEESQSNYKSQAKKYASYQMDDESHFLDDYLYRQLLYSGCLFFFSVFAVGRMFTYISTPDCGYPEWHEHYKTFSFGFLFCGIALFFILFGSLIGFILSIARKQAIGFIIFCVLLSGAFLYVIGSFIIIAEVPYIYCEVGASSSLLGGHGCVYFGEFFLISSLSMLLGIDFWKDKVLNDFRLRMILYCSLIAFCSLICFFGYAILGNYLSKEGRIETTYIGQDYEFVASGWFFIFISMVIYLFVLLCHASKSIIFIFCSCVLIMATLLCAIGYWALNERGDDALNAYYIGYSFFLIAIGVILAIDMSFGQYIKKYILKR